MNIVKPDAIIKMFNAGNLIHIRTSDEYLVFAHMNGNTYAVSIEWCPFFLIKRFAPELMEACCKNIERETT